MEPNRDKPPWWIFQPAPSVIVLLPLFALLAAVFVFLLLAPLIRWLR